MVDRSPGSRSLGRVLLAALVSLLVVPAHEVLAQGALDALRRGIEAQATFHRGKAAYDAGDFARARDQLSEAVSLDPSHDEARALLGWSQYFLGEYRGAVIAFKAALARRPEWAGLWDGLGWSRLRLRRYHLATEAFRAALERSPESVDALIGLGTARFELEAYDAALEPLRKVQRLLKPLYGPEPPELAGVTARVAWSLYYLRRYPEALGEFQQGLRSNPELHGLHSGVGWCQLRLGRRQEAREAFERALRLKPDYADAREGLRQIGG